MALFAIPAATSYVPQAGDHFSYYESENLGSGTGDYVGYSEQTIVNGMERINAANADGTLSATYSYSWTWQNSTGTTENGNSSGDFTFSPVTFLYVNGTDDQTGYINPTVWFSIDNSIPIGGTFTLLNTEMTVVSRDYSFYLTSQGKNVNSIFAQGTSSYLRNDQYGQFTATYTWKAYFDPSSGYIIGYNYVEHDTNSSGTGFTYTENLYVTSTSYQLTTAATSPVELNSTSTQYLLYIIGITLLIVILAIIVYAISRRSRRLPRHSYQQAYRPEPASQNRPPESIDLTPKQPPVQQIVVKEVVKVKCRYCGALIDSTALECPICGAPRT